jgi:hypothetical protein
MSTEQMRYLMSTIGLNNTPVSMFHVEYVTAGGGYSMTRMSASTLSEVTEMAVEDNKHTGPIAIMYVDPVEVGVTKELALKNHPRID